MTPLRWDNYKIFFTTLISSTVMYHCVTFLIKEIKTNGNAIGTVCLCVAGIILSGTMLCVSCVSFKTK